MKRRLLLSAGSAATLSVLTGCGGGGSATAGTSGAAATADLSPREESTGPVSTDNPAAATDSPATESQSPTNESPASEQPTDSTGTSALPAKVLACYYTSWDTGTHKITAVPSEFNVIYLFHAKPNGTPINGSWNNVGNGSFRFEHYDGVTAAQVQTCRSRGQKVILTVGGAQAGFNFNSRTKSQNFIASFRAMYDNFGGLDGCDFNNFEAGIGSSATEMIWIAQQLKSLYGQDFAITAPPQPNSPEDRAMLKAMSDAGVLTWAGPQYYDWSGFNEPGFISRRTDDWVRDIGASKTVLGLAANYGNGPSLADCIREWDAVKAKYPAIRGAFCWSAQLNLSGGNTWGKTMKQRL